MLHPGSSSASCLPPHKKKPPETKKEKKKKSCNLCRHYVSCACHAPMCARCARCSGYAYSTVSIRPTKRKHTHGRGNGSARIRGCMPVLFHISTSTIRIVQGRATMCYTDDRESRPHSCVRVPVLFQLYGMGPCYRELLHQRQGQQVTQPLACFVPVVYGAQCSSAPALAAYAAGFRSCSSATPKQE